MPLRVGILSTAHMHAYGYAHGLKTHPRAELAGIWDPDGDRAQSFSRQFEARVFESRQSLLEQVDAVIVTCENKLHVENIASAAATRRPILCEKPLVTSKEEWQAVQSALQSSGAKLMTAFPCRYSPAFKRLLERVRNGEIGGIQAICATNRGRCPGGWFTDLSLSGGGAMIDHVVHVADLLRVLLGKDPVSVQAFTGNNMYGQDWEDTAMLTLQYEDGLFASLDSSWSRPQAYKTWGDVTISVVGEKGVIEMDLFKQALDVYGNSASPSHNLCGYGSDLDAALVDDFVRCVEEDSPPPISAEDGWKAVRVALAGYESAGIGEPISLA